MSGSSGGQHHWIRRHEHSWHVVGLRGGDPCALLVGLWHLRVRHAPLHSPCRSALQECSGYVSLLSQVIVFWEWFGDMATRDTPDVDVPSPDVASSVILRKAVCWTVDSWIMCWNCLLCGLSPLLITVFALHVGSCTFDLFGVRVHWRHYWNQCPVLLYPQHAVGWLPRSGLVRWEVLFQIYQHKPDVIWNSTAIHTGSHLFGGELAVLIDTYPCPPIWTVLLYVIHHINVRRQ